MQWFYALNGQRVGPVSNEQFAQLVAADTITSETLVWREGLPNWVKWGEIAAQTPLPEVSSAPVAPGFAAGQAEGEAPSGEAANVSWTIDEFSQRLRQNGFGFSFGGGFGRIWNNVTDGYWLGLGVVLVATILMAIVSFIPVVSLIGAFVVTPQLTAGIAWFYLKRTRGEAPAFDTVFDGFRLRFGSLAGVAAIQLLAGIVMAIGLFVLMLPFGVSFGDIEAGEAMEPAAAGAFAVVMFLVVIVMSLLAGRFLLVHVILLDQPQTGVIDAFRLSWRITGPKFWTLVLLALVVGLINMAAALLLIVPLIFTMPIFHATLAQVYEDARLSAAGTPPEPV